MLNLKPGRGRVVLYLALLLFSSLVLLTINVKGSRQPGVVEYVVSILVSPLQEAVTGSVRFVSSVWDRYCYLVGVVEENERLKSEIARIEGLEIQLVETRLEHERLLVLLKVKKATPTKSIVAKVIGYDSTNWSRTLTIGKGSIEGIRRKMPVISAGGLVGKVESVAPLSSKVLLITDIRNAVDAIIRQGRGTGVVVGSNNDICGMKYVSLEESVQKGGRVISSGLGGVYPKGLLVGVVQKVEKKEFGLFQVVTVRPSADLDHLEEVLVILNGNI